MLVPLLQNLFGSAGEIITPTTEPGAFRFGFSSYPGFRATLQTLIDGDDFSQSTISVAVLALFVLLGEKRIYRDVRSSTQEGALGLIVAGNAAPLPFDTIEVRSLYFTSGV